MLGWLATMTLGAALAWCYWPTFEKMAERWSNDPQYSHGFLVPLFALIILGMRGSQWRQAAWQPSGWGLPFLLAGAGLRLYAASRDIVPLDGLSLLPTLVGLVILSGGWQMLRWCWPALTFLIFMVPLPHQLEIALSHPLRALATSLSTFFLQLLGYPALREGNVILIDEVRLGVIDACSGLGMLMTFFALATALALVIRAPLFDRLFLIVSAVPIAVIANVLRITGTGIAYAHSHSEAAHAIMHDLAGWLMMPIALLLLGLETWFLARLFYQETAKPLTISLPAGPPARPAVEP